MNTDEYLVLRVRFDGSFREYDYLIPSSPELREEILKGKEDFNSLSKFLAQDCAVEVNTKTGEEGVELVDILEFEDSSGKANSVVKYAWIGNYIFKLDEYKEEKSMKRSTTTAAVTEGMDGMMGNYMDKMFKKVDNVVLDMMSGKTGVSKDGSIYTCTKDEDGDFILSENMMGDFGMPLPAFATATDVKLVKEGDIVVNKSSIGWATKIDTAKGTVKILTVNGTYSNIKPAKNTMMGGAANVMVIKNMMGDTEGLGQMQNMIMPMMAMGGDNTDLEKIMPMMMMSQSGMIQGDGMGNMMQMMMMAKMFK